MTSLPPEEYIETPPKVYAVIHAVCGLFEGYSDTSCDWFPTKEAAQKHVKQMCETYREDEMCVNIDHALDSTYVTMDRDPDNYKAWDYYPLCMSLVARVSSDVMDNQSDHSTQALHDLAQLGEFISAVYYRNEAFIDLDDYTMHAFRIPKKLKTNEA